MPIEGRTIKMSWVDEAGAFKSADLKGLKEALAKMSEQLKDAGKSFQKWPTGAGPNGGLIDPESTLWD